MRQLRDLWGKLGHIPCGWERLRRIRGAGAGSGRRSRRWLFPAQPCSVPTAVLVQAGHRPGDQAVEMTHTKCWACTCVRAQTSNPDVNVGHFPSRFPFWVIDNTALVTVTGAFVLLKSSNQINKLGPAVNSVIFQTKRSDQSYVSAITGLFMPVQRVVQWPEI